MKLKALELENFKGISDKVRIEFSPITLLFGPNNAGKSTVLHALIYAREIFERGDVDPRYTEMGGDTVDLGGFDSLVFGHDRFRRIRMRFEFEVSPNELLDGIEWKPDQDFDPHDHGIYDWDHKEFNASSPPYRPSVYEALESIQPNSIDLEVGWSEELQIPVVHGHTIGNASMSTPILRLKLDEKESAVVLSYLDFGTIELGRIETEESQRLFERKVREQKAWQVIDEIGEQNYVDVVGSPVPRARLTTEQWHQEIRRVAPPRLITTQKLLTGLVKPEHREADGMLKPRILKGCSSPIPAATQRFQMASICYPRGPVPYDEWYAYDAKCEFSADATSDVPPSQKPKKPAHDPSLSDWRNPDQVRRDFLEPLYNAISVGFVNCCRSFLADSLYLSSVRVHPPRDFHAVQPLDPRRWPNGLAAWDLMMAKEDEIVPALNEWLSDDNSKFDSGFRIDVQSVKHVDAREPSIAKLISGDDKASLEDVRTYLAKLPEERQLRIRDIASGVLGQPRDVGYGLSQLLPVIVAALHTKSGIVAVEEPESNIHPAFQVVLADLFLTQAKANQNALFLIETHSEHLMLRFLRRIRETSGGELGPESPAATPEDAAVHFVEPSERGPVIHRIRIDEDGEFMDPWPPGFFPERMKEIYGDDL